MMNSKLQETLEKLLRDSDETDEMNHVWGNPGRDDDAELLAPKIERALRAERKAGFLRAAKFYYDGGYSESVRLSSLDVEEEPLTAGVAAMVEEK